MKIGGVSIADKELANIFEEAIEQGWRVERGAKHLKLFAPNGDQMFAPSTSSDWRVRHRIISKMARSGFRRRKKDGTLTSNR